VSPGVLGLLVPHGKDPRVATRWRDALEHPSSQVRGTAARLLLAAGQTAAVPDLLKMLSAETDPAAALEAAHTVLILGSSQENAVLAAARRLEAPALTIAVVERLGPSAIERLGEFRTTNSLDNGIAKIVDAMARDASALDRVAAYALSASDVRLWAGALAFSHAELTKVSDERMASALNHPSPLIRAYAWWYVAVLAAGGSAMPRSWRDPSDDTLQGVPATLALGHELAIRVLKKTKGTPMKVAMISASDEWPIPMFARIALDGPLYEHVDSTERETLALKKAGRNAPTLIAPPAATTTPQVRTPAALPDGYVADVLKVSGCEPSGPVVLAAAVVRYSPIRHLQELQWAAATELKGPCADAARAILAAALLPPPGAVKPGDRNWILLPMSHQYLQCLAGTAPAGKPKGKVGENGIIPPRKTKHVNPTFPPQAIEARQQGVVILEATIAPSGCVEYLEVRRGVSMVIDVEALRAVSSWVFTPTVLNGAPVPVNMTVSVHFSLQ
jgi:protein TonB